MDWRDIPSLSALRAFEATARHGSFSAAARELNVTHAAIAQHVRALEAEFGQDLVFRAGVGMELTDAGQVLAQALGEGFASIANGVRQMRKAGDSRPLRVTLTHAFAENWIMPRLGGFWATHPDIPLVLVPAQESVDLRLQGFDLALRYGRGNWPNTRSELLVPAAFVIVGRPELLCGVSPKDDAELCALPWLIDEGWPEQNLYMEELGVTADQAKITKFATYPMTLAAVRSGLGVSVLKRPMVEADLAAGELVALRELPATDLGYYIVTPNGRPSDHARTFIRWLKSIE
ncbi:LysR family transcriptional regulator [Aliiroseovarius sp. KMU-50]|uniref:LysR family transcriptional regulator n=1 Tax=Aliiroseovarius salicola TaxID=3009082 RepID=A0ABT4VXI2_9RHOB|nr:LysR family transcriptional regulator [Aliiroseovarius sp. KMU-50]MDA5092931.1 LysR family transcriptional regulator [Aliiroseovarius sp. KMU-50]